MTQVAASEAIGRVKFEEPSSYLQAILKLPLKGADDL